MDKTPTELIDEALADMTDPPKATTDFAIDSHLRIRALVKGMAAIASALETGLAEIADAIRDHNKA